MHANIQQLIELSQTINGQTQESIGVVRKYHNEIGSKASNLLIKHAIDDPQHLQDVLIKAQQQDRLMYIGIVGRVKAGKSSLLNALFFDGQHVLPSAATPMTAALTTLSYGTAFAAEVDFYTESDLTLIKQRAAEYEQKLRSETLRLRQENRDRAKPQTEDASFDEKIQRIAKRTLKHNHQLEAAYDQFQRMQTSGLNRAELTQANSIQVSDLETLKTQLLEYVGAGGRFMPFTKSVNIQLPLERLKDICVVDTPGFNDPVQSREARTHELLKSCDVIFIVSPAGQFLSEQDLDMMGRITQKEGIQELFVVASQVDTQLFGSDIRQPTLKGALDRVTKTLGCHMVSTLEKFKQDQPEVGSTFDQLINNSHHKILYASGISHALAQKQPSDWSDGEKTVWNNLTQYYPDYFSNQDKIQSQSSLKLLANVGELQQVLQRVRDKKEQIKQEHLKKLISDKQKSLISFSQGLIEACDIQHEQVRTSDIENILVQINNLKVISKKLKIELNPIATSSKNQLAIDIRNEINGEINRKFINISKQASNSVSTDQESYSVQKSGVGSWFARKIWGGGYETRHREVTKVMTNPLYTSLNDFIHETMQPLSAIFMKLVLEFGKNFKAEMISSYRRVLDDDRLFNEVLVMESVESFMSKRPTLQFNTKIKIPSSLSPRGKLSGDDADQYMSEYTKFINDLKNEMIRNVECSISDINILPDDISNPFCAEIEEHMNSLKTQIEKREMTLSRLEQLKKELNIILIKY